MNELDKLKDFILTYYAVSSCYPSPVGILNQIEAIKQDRTKPAMPEHLYQQNKVEIGNGMYDLKVFGKVFVDKDSMYYGNKYTDETHSFTYTKDFTREDALAIQDLWRRL